MKNKALPVSILTKRQVKTETKTVNGGKKRIEVSLRYDDSCGNGHNSFGITADIYTKTKNGRWAFESCGCCHEEISKYFSAYRDAIKWHLCSSDGPMHYVANTRYHASDKDCWGLRKDEKRQIKNGITEKLSWVLEDHANIKKYVNSDTEPVLPDIKLKYIPWCRIGEGKEPDIEAARSCAIWPDATSEQLQDKEQLTARLPALMKEFKVAMESLGFTY